MSSEQLHTGSLLNDVTQRFRPGTPGWQVAVLSGGTAAAQAVGVLAFPVLTRQYSEADFGFLGFYVAVLSVLLILGSWRYEQSIPLPAHDATATNLVALSFGILLGMCGLSAVVLAALAALTGDRTPLADGRMIMLLVAGLAIAGSFQILNYWAIRREKFKRIAAAKLTQGSTQALTQIAMGVLGAGPYGLVAGDVIGRTGSASVHALSLLKRNAVPRRSVTAATVRAAAREYKNFPLYQVWTGLLNALSLRLPSLLFPVFFDMSVLGYYFLAERVLTLPVALISQSVMMVFYQRASQCRNRGGNLRQMTLRLYGTLAAIAVPPGLLFMLFAPQCFSVVFGSTFATAGRYARYLVPWILLVLIVQPASGMLSVVNRQERRLVLESFSFALRASAFLVGALWLRSPLATVACCGAAGFAANALLAVCILRSAPAGDASA